jgi:prevent-host-death family protein
MQVNIHDAKTHFSRLVERARAGEEIVIAKAGKPVAKLVPVEELGPRVPGGWEGIIVDPDWDSPGVNKEIEKLFEESVIFPEDDG